jgi:hypothetical protein
MLSVEDKELISLMKQKTEEFCDQVITKFKNKEYANNESEIEKNIKKWRNKKIGLMNYVMSLSTILKKEISI